MTDYKKTQQPHPARFVFSTERNTFRARKTAFGLRLLLGHYPSPSDTLVDQIAASYHRADTVGDDVAAELFADPSVRQQINNPHDYLRRAVEEGSDSVDASLTPALKKMLQEAETPPDWLQEDKLELACRVIHRCGRFAMLQKSHLRKYLRVPGGVCVLCLP